MIIARRCDILILCVTSARNIRVMIEWVLLCVWDIRVDTLWRVLLLLTSSSLVIIV